MIDKLPDFIDPLIFANRQRQLTGAIALNKLSRLNNILCNNDSDLSIDLSFSKNNQGLVVIGGMIQAQLNVECQRCLESMDLPLKLTINIAVVNSLAQADLLAGEYDPFISTEKKMSLTQLIEDEILLALPDFPRHQQACLSYFDNLTKNQPAPSNHPFSILAQLKNTGDS